MLDAQDQCPDVAQGSEPDPAKPGCPDKDTDKDGVVDSKDQCPSQPKGDHPDPAKLGCPDKDTDSDGVFDAQDQCLKVPAGGHPDPAKTVPLAAMPVGDGFTASWQALRDCVTWLTQSPDAQALIVDRATYDGNAAGVIVAPATLPDADLSTPSPTVTVDTGQGVFDVWVVNPECKQKWNSLDDFPLYAWGQ